MDLCSGAFEDGGEGWGEIKERRERLWDVDSYGEAKKYLDRMGFVVEKGEVRVYEERSDVTR